MIKLKKLVSCAVMAAAVSLGASLVEAAIPVTPPSAGSGTWTGGVGALIDFNSIDNQLVLATSESSLSFFAQNCCNPGSAFLLVLDGVGTPWTTADNNGTLGGSGLFEAVWTGAAAAGTTFSLVVSEDSGFGEGAMQWSLAAQTAPVPEPEIYAMLAAGLGMLGFLKRRRKAQGAAAA